MSKFLIVTAEVYRTDEFDKGEEGWDLALLYPVETPEPDLRADLLARLNAYWRELWTAEKLASWKPFDLIDLECGGGEEPGQPGVYRDNRVLWQSRFVDLLPLPAPAEDAQPAPAWRLGQVVEYANGFRGTVAAANGDLAVILQHEDSRAPAGFVLAEGSPESFYFPVDDVCLTFTEAFAELRTRQDEREEVRGFRIGDSVLICSMQDEGRVVMVTHTDHGGEFATVELSEGRYYVVFGTPDSYCNGAASDADHASQALSVEDAEEIVVEALAEMDKARDQKA